ncbi:DoxX family protein [Fodinibius halophilus]|uniref:DoxX family protein n=1 Tax=Fodinibius halophilus TaxID=1736908 RepID=A0A6M1TBJ3_9BACT|nr:DoxX family protein [Fodinibius halophilus]NGP87662.1 DoxX family protein [Fodinibius halophilus]
MQQIHLSHKKAEIIFRIMLSLIFIIAGSNHLFATSAVSRRLQNSDLGTWLTTYLPPELLVLLAGIGLIVAGFFLLLGFKTRLAESVLLLIIIPITIVIQLQGLHTLGPLFKNIGLMGALIHFMANGSTHYSTDHYLSNE